MNINIVLLNKIFVNETLMSLFENACRDLIAI